MYGRRNLFIRLIYLAVAIIWRVFSVVRKHPRPRQIVLCYHSVLDGQREAFEDQIRRIRDAAVSLDSIDGRPHLSRRPSVCITFDDGFENLCRNALPALTRHAVPATIFVVTGNLGTRPGWPVPADRGEKDERLMSRDELVRAERSAPVRIGSHTVSHPRLTELSDDRLLRELGDSKRELEMILHHPVHDLALPHGEFDHRVLRIARSAGYKRICTLQERLYQPTVDGDCVGRFLVSPDMWPIEFALTACGAYAWLGPFRALIRHARSRFRAAAENSMPAIES